MSKPVFNCLSMSRLHCKKALWSHCVFAEGAPLDFLITENTVQENPEKVKVFGGIWLSVTPWTEAHQAPLSMEFSRQEYWSELPFPIYSRGSSQPRTRIHVSCIFCIGRQILYHWATWNPLSKCLLAYQTKIIMGNYFFTLCLSFFTCKMEYIIFLSLG